MPTLIPLTIDPTNVTRGADRFVFANGSGLRHDLRLRERPAT